MNWLELVGLIESSPKGEPLYMQIVKFVADGIASGALREGERMPTNRELAAILRVDRSTVARAYAELIESRRIESHVGRGTFVRTNTANRRGSTEFVSDSFNWTELFSRASGTLADVIGKQPTAPPVGPATISFAGGLPTEEFYPSLELQEIVRNILDSPEAKNLFEYSPAEGHPALRSEVLKHLAEQGIVASEEELLIVGGSQQAIDLVTNVFVDPGDAVLLEDPSYFWAICNLRSHQARCIPVPVDENGIDVDAVERELARSRPKLIYVMPSFQNPTGSALSVERRMRLLEVATRFNVPILEDNFVGDLRYDDKSLPALRALPGGRDIVIHQGTFSKALCPGLRLGWLVAPKQVRERLLLAKRVSDLSTNSMAQLTLSQFLSAGLYGRHLERVRAAYKARRDAMLGALEQHFTGLSHRANISWYKPHGGLFVWMKLPSFMSARELLRFAESEGVTFSPGDLFFLSGERRENLRLCFIQTNELSIREGIRRLSQAFDKYSDSIRDTGKYSQESFARTTEQVLI
jgi:DNA-binding transcriptional MocR family regulator